MELYKVGDKVHIKNVDASIINEVINKSYDEASKIIKQMVEPKKKLRIWFTDENFNEMVTFLKVSSLRYLLDYFNEYEVKYVIQTNGGFGFTNSKFIEVDYPNGEITVSCYMDGIKDMGCVIRSFLGDEYLDKNMKIEGTVAYGQMIIFKVVD